MSSRSRSLEKKPSRPTNPPSKTKSAGRSQSGSGKKANREKSEPSSSSKTKSQPKKRNRSDVSRSKSKSSISSKKSKEKDIVARKKSNTKKISIQNDPCVCGPDFYAKVLGPTADETILVGLETFMKFCHECPETKEENLLVDSGTGLFTKESEESPSGKKSSNQLLDEPSTTDTPEKEVLVAEVALNDNSTTEEEAPVVPELSGRNVSINESAPKQSGGKSRSLNEEAPVVPELSGRNVSIKESAQKQSSGKSRSLNDPPLAQSSRTQIRSKEPLILEEPDKEKSEERLSVIEIEEGGERLPRIASKSGSFNAFSPPHLDSNLQTASTSSSQTDGPQVRHDVSQTGSIVEVGSSQTPQQSPSDAESQTGSAKLRASGSQSKHNRSLTSRMATFNSSRDNKCMSDSSTSSSKLKDSGESCPCCGCTHCDDTTSSETTSPTEKSSAAEKSSPCSCPSCKTPSPRKSCLKSPKCKCNTSTSTSSNVNEKRQVRVNCACTPQTVSVTPTTVDLDLEETTQNAASPKGDADGRCVKVRYAITKITKFYSYTTFEVMRSTRKKPKVMPKSLEGVFVLKNCMVQNATPIVS